MPDSEDLPPNTDGLGPQAWGLKSGSVVRANKHSVGDQIASYGQMCCEWEAAIKPSHSNCGPPVERLYSNIVGALGNYLP